VSEGEQLMKEKVQNNPDQASYLLQLLAHDYAVKHFDTWSGP